MIGSWPVLVVGRPGGCRRTEGDAGRGLRAQSGNFWEAQDCMSAQPFALRSFLGTIYSPLRLPVGLCPAGASPGGSFGALRAKHPLRFPR